MPPGTLIVMIFKIQSLEIEENLKKIFTSRQDKFEAKRNSNKIDKSYNFSIFLI